MLKKAGYALILLGFIFIGLASIKAYEIIEDAKYASTKTNEVLEELTELIEDQTPSINYGEEIKYVEVDGEKYIGIIDIPSIDLTLPIYKDWDYDKLKIGPCRYYGSYVTDDLILMSHNYWNQFNKIKNATKGDLIHFITADKNIYTYKIEYYETLEPTEVSRLEKKTDWDLTLFTCNGYGITRHVVRCSKIR